MRSDQLQWTVAKWDRGVIVCNFARKVYNLPESDFQANRMKLTNWLSTVALGLVVAGCGDVHESEDAALAAQSPRTVKEVREFLDYVGDSVAGGVIEAHWSERGAGLWFIASEGSAHELRWYDLGEEELSVVMRFDALATQLADIGVAIGRDDIAIDAYDRQSGEIIVRLPDDRRFRANVDSEGIEEIHGTRRVKPEMVRASFPIAGWNRYEILSPDGSMLASLSDRNFALRDAESGDVTVLTDDGHETFEYMFAPDLWESSGSPWSADSRYVLARSHDMRGVTGIPITDFMPTPEEFSWFRYWARAGRPLPLTTFYIFNIDDGAVVTVDASGDDQHMAFFVDWAPDSSEFVYLRYARDLTTLELIAVDPTNGFRRTLLEETRQDGWVKWPAGPQTVTYLPSGNGFIWRSDRSGFFQYYLYDRDGTFQRAITDGTYPAGHIVGIDEAGDWLYFMAPSDNSRPYDMHLNRTRLSETGGHQRLTHEIGQHQVTLSPDKQWFITEHSHLDRPPRSDLHTANGRFIGTLARSTVDPQRADWPAAEEFVAQAADGVTEVHGLIMKPHGFDDGMQYPVIERIYGGMQAQAVPRDFVGHRMQRPGSEYYTMLEYLRSQGYVVIVMDTPGTPGRGREFHLRTHGSWPDGIIDDHAAVLRQLLAAHSYMDAGRIGIEGNSWGGQLAVRGLTDAPQLYKAASAAVPETDLLDHVHWIEFQNGTPQNNPDAYQNGTTALVDQIDGELLLIHGTSDANVPFSNTMKLVDALTEAGKYYELVILPGTNHALQGNGDRYSYAVYRIARFFDRTLRQGVD